MDEKLRTDRKDRKANYNFLKGLSPIGPYAQVRKVKGFIFVSGQIPIDPNTGELVKGNFEKQARRVLENLKLLLETDGSSINHVVKFSVFLKDLNNFATFNKIYEEYFDKDPLPVRTCVGVPDLLKGAEIEIDAIGVCDKIKY